MSYPFRAKAQSAVVFAPFDECGCSTVISNRSSSKQAFRPGAQAPLGMYGSIAGRSAESGLAENAPIHPTILKKRDSYKEKRENLWSLQRTAANLLYPKGTAKEEIKGVGTCRWAAHANSPRIDVMMTSYAKSDSKRASYAGLQTCGEVWRCPCCGQRISQTRRDEMNHLMAWARSNGHFVRMVTLTSRHGASDTLKDMLVGMKEAKQSFHSRRDYKRLRAEGLIGVVTATEVTHGKNGWHVHFHMILIVKSRFWADYVADLGDAWRASLRGRGLDGNAAAFDCSNADRAGRYIAKWGAAEELTLGTRKEGREGGRTPLQLLQDAADGDKRAAALWIQFTQDFYRRQQLVWSRGLKALIGLDEIDDAEAATDETQDEQVQDDLPITSFDRYEWRTWARNRRTQILDAAEEGGAAAVWALKPDGPLIDDEPPPKSKSQIEAELDALLIDNDDDPPPHIEKCG